MFGGGNENRRRRSFGERVRDHGETLWEWIRRIGPYVLLGLVAVAIPYLVFLGYRRVMASPYFQISQIEVKGAEYADGDKLERRAGLMRGLNIFDIDPERSREAIESNPWVEGAEVDCQLPDRVVVRVRERRPAALLAADGYHVLDADGDPITTLDEQTAVEGISEWPLLTGLDRRELQRDYGRRLVRSALHVARLYEEMGLDEADPISEIHLEPVMGLTLVTRHKGIEIRLGRGRYRERLERLRRVRRSLAERTIEPAYILLDHERDINRVVVGRRHRQGSAGGESQ